LIRHFCHVKPSILFLLGLLLANVTDSQIGLVQVGSADEKKSEIQGKVKKEVFEKADSSREIFSYAHVEKTTVKKMPAPKIDYSFYVLAKIGQSIPFTQKVLTQYHLYSELVPFVDKTEFDPKTKTMKVEGGIWKYRLKSLIKVHEITVNKIEFKVIQGHLTGLICHLILEPSLDGRSTRVYFGGELHTFSKNSPPSWVLEKGAEIVLGFTAKKMRSKVESEARSVIIKKKENSEGAEIPKPRRSI